MNSNNISLIIFLASFIASCSSKFVGTYSSNAEVFGPKKFISLKPKNNFYYKHIGDTGSSEGEGKYYINADSLVLLFDNKTRMLEDKNVTKLKADSIIIEWQNVNKNTESYGARYKIVVSDTYPPIAFEVNSVKDLKFGESNTIYLPKQVDSVSGWLHTYHHKIYNFNFNEKAHYVIKKEMEIGPEGKLNNLSMCFKILKNTQDSLVFIDERFPNTLYKKRTLKE